MKILITGDLHLNDKPRDSYRHEFMRKLPDLCRRHGVERVILLGDLTDEKDRHQSWLVNKVVGYIKDLIPVIIVRGNHDALDPSSPFFAFLDSLTHVTWINKPTEMLLFERTWFHDALFLPHTSDYQRDWSAGLNFSGYKWVFTHNTFAGANIGARTLEGIPLDIFPDGVRVISGDIHEPQTIGPVTYVGAPYRVDFGDEYVPRMLILEDGKLKSLKCQGPQKRLLKIEVQHLETLPKIFNAGDIIKVRLWMTPAESTKWFEYKQVINAWGKDHGLIIHSVQFMVVAPGTEGREVVHQQPRKDDEELLQEYATARGLDEPTVTAGLNLMRKA